jgi:hypothetical protein
MEFVLEKYKIVIMVIETKRVKALEVATSMEILQQDFKASNA